LQEVVLQVVLPNRLVPLLQIFAAPDIVDDYVQPPLLGPYARHKVAHLSRNQVIDLDGDSPTAGRGDQLGGLFDGLGSVARASSFR
jgi:hypothetical protein